MNLLQEAAEVHDVTQVKADKPNKDWFLYFIRTNKGSLYTGITTNVERRFAEHKSAGKLGAKYLKGKGPLQLEFSVKVGSRSQALKLEYQVKQLSKTAKEKVVLGMVQLPSLFPELVESDNS